MAGAACRLVIALAVMFTGCAAPPPSVPAAATPATGWTRLADMPAGLAKFGLAALDGRLYVLGGYDTRRAVLVYDIAADRWQPGPDLPRGSDNLAAVAVGGRVIALGGEAGTAMQLLDPAAGRWFAGPALPRVRFASVAAELDGRIHVVAGWNADNKASASLDSQDIFQIASSTWLPGPFAALTTARNAAAGAVVDGRLHVVGGRAPGIRANDHQSLASTEVYTPASGRWAPGPLLPVARASLAAAALGGRLYVFGGETRGGVVSNAVERLDPVKQVWEALPPMPYRAHGLGAVAIGQAIYVMGGFTGPSDAVGSESVALYRYQPPR